MGWTKAYLCNLGWTCISGCSFCVVSIKMPSCASTPCHDGTDSWHNYVQLVFTPLHNGGRLSNGLPWKILLGILRLFFSKIKAYWYCHKYTIVHVYTCTGIVIGTRLSKQTQQKELTAEKAAKKGTILRRNRHESAVWVDWQSLELARTGGSSPSPTQRNPEPCEHQGADQGL